MIEIDASAVIDFPCRPGSPITVPPRRLTYAQIADDLEARIRRGQYPPGGLLPSYAEIAELYSVGVSTAQFATRILRERRLTESVPGVGIFVVDPIPDE